LFSHVSDGVVRGTVAREREVAVSAQALGYAVCVPLTSVSDTCVYTHTLSERYDTAVL
jgi:hypothetical protein